MKYTLVREGDSQWINSPSNGGECCQTKADTVEELNRLYEEVSELRSRTSVSMGVGNGSGKLFVYGDLESIQAAQAIVLRAERMSARVEELQKEVWALKSHNARLIDSNIEAWGRVDEG